MEAAIFATRAAAAARCASERASGSPRTRRISRCASRPFRSSASTSASTSSSWTSTNADARTKLSRGAVRRGCMFRFGMKSSLHQRGQTYNAIGDDGRNTFYPVVGGILPTLLATRRVRTRSSAWASTRLACNRQCDWRSTPYAKEDERRKDARRQ
jgi:hypothetical protein